MSSPVKDFYKNKNVLLTGGTGYLGKMMIEKLLRTTEVKNIYIVVRPKQDIDVEKRVIKIFQEPIFADISEDVFLEKVHPIEGDLKMKLLGISSEKMSHLRAQVNIVFHCGASLNMDANLADAVSTNVNGTAEILEIIKGAQSLEAFILVSTAYSNCLNEIIEEVFYDPPIDPNLLLRITKEMKAEHLNNISKGILGKWPNTYTFTKALAESLLITEGKNIPVAVFRPTIVTSTVSEPVAGWTDNLYGPLGILLSSNCGILRVVQGNPSVKADTVPGDLVINGLLCYAWEVATQWNLNRSNYKPCVMNFSGRSSPLYVSIKEYSSTATNSGYIPFKKIVWKPILFIVDNKWLYMGMRFLLHKIPAYLFDYFLAISGRKPQMKKLYVKLDKVTRVFHYFLTQEWTIKNNNLQSLWQKLTPSDRETYNFDLTKIDADQYYRNMMIGLKKYTLKEDMSRAQYHKAKFQRMQLLHDIFKYIIIVLISHLVLRKLLPRWISRVKHHCSL
ncbi:fatty acyl-CoA reductase wat-like [Euwallacea fornicatus]|uniref:fatty acyl-CoA reductase wat-like n=1 Tax=Euwallacea fornicatus TaxID=995702 RepID=UPI00338EEE35